MKIGIEKHISSKRNDNIIEIKILNIIGAQSNP